MAAGYPIEISGIRIRTSEALYQACRFPHMPTVQKLIIDEVSPMTAKMRAKPYRRDSRPDWDAVRIPIMKWCLRVKLAQNWSTFGSLLLETGDQAIVEDSTKDDFWGAMRDEGGILRGRNVLGRLLMELREKLRTEPESLETVESLPLPDFLLLSRPIPIVSRSDLHVTSEPVTARSKPDFAVPEQQDLLTDVPVRPAAPTVEKVEPKNTAAMDPAVPTVRVPQPTSTSHPAEEGDHSGGKDRRVTLVAAAAGGFILILIVWLMAG
jgi:ribA/ribD-fused uncharacterized protein